MKQYSIYSLLVILFFSALTLSACRDSADQPYTRAEEEILSQNLRLPLEPFVYPTSVQAMFFPEDGGSTGNLQQIALGRVLFYETSLSADGTISCASCHHQELAFSDNVAFSEGVHGNLTDRNSFPLGSFPTIMGVYNNNGEVGVPGDSLNPSARGVFWDERAADLFEQMQETFENPKEMGIDVRTIPDRLEGLDYYPILFERAYGDGNGKITPVKTMEALQAFMQTFVNISSRYDHALGIAIREGQDLLGDFSGLSPEENQGKRLFRANCASCHMVTLNFLHHETLGSGKATACNGLDQTYTDKGVGQHSGNPELDGVFKIPALRNIAVTAPYMHDGRFGTLEEVIHHYNEGIQAHANLDPFLKDEQGEPKRLNLSQEEIDALLAFLNTLTNEDLLTHEKWADPFL
ncbi:MAG: cytochrome c peroxidase [Bacteroidota bacterium]